MDTVDFYAKRVWDYMHLDHIIEKADLIFVLGSNDVRVADRAAELYNSGFAPLVVCSGGNGKESIFPNAEAEIFSERMVELGVPRRNILLEDKATNTGENISFTKDLLKRKGLSIGKIIAVQKPYMERRTFAAISKQWKEVSCVVTSPKLSYDSYVSGLSSKESFLHTMVGDLLRIREYPRLGFQIEQEIPVDVWNAGQELLKMGFNKYKI